MFFMILFLAFPELSPAQGSKIARQDFLQKFQADFSEKFCGDKSYFRSCFALKAESCKPGLAPFLKSCISELEGKMPESLQQPEDGRNWGRQIGSCAGEKFEKENAAGKKATKECSDPEKWK